MSTDQVGRGQTFMWCVRNPRNINTSSGYPAGRIGDRGDQEIVYVPILVLPLLVFLEIHVFPLRGFPSFFFPFFH